MKPTNKLLAIAFTTLSIFANSNAMMRTLLARSTAACKMMKARLVQNSPLRQRLTTLSFRPFTSTARTVASRSSTKALTAGGLGLLGTAALLQTAHADEAQQPAQNELLTKYRAFKTYLHDALIRTQQNETTTEALHELRADNPEFSMQNPEQSMANFGAHVAERMYTPSAVGGSLGFLIGSTICDAKNEVCPAVTLGLLGAGVGLYAGLRWALSYDYYLDQQEKAFELSQGKDIRGAAAQDNAEGVLAHLKTDNEHYVQQPDNHGRLLLHYIAANGADKTFFALNAQGYFSTQAINTCDKTGRTPTHYAALQGKQTVLESLKFSGANFFILDAQGITPADILSASNPELAEELGLQHDQTRSTFAKLFPEPSGWYAE